MLKNVYIAGPVRTPHGAFNGAYASMTAAQLGSVVVAEAIKRAGITGEDVDEVIMGNVVSAGLGQNVARQATLGAGLPLKVGATTVNKVCGSSMRAIMFASQAIQCGDSGVVVAGGCESMTNAPYYLYKARSGYRMGDGVLVDGMIKDGLWDVYSDRHMGVCGDQCAEKYNITREQQDDFAVESFHRAIKAWDDGFYAKEIVPVEIKSRKSTVVVDKDEDVAKFRGDDKLRALRPAFGKEGTVTAGNASGIDDGASALVVFGDEQKEKLGIKPVGKVLGFSIYATEPDQFTVAPIGAIKGLCEKLSIKPGDVDLFEINEAFAVVAQVTINELKLDHGKVNIAGGAVAMGHPIGSSGSRIVVTLLNALEHKGKKLGIATACLGGGEAIAIAVERC